MNCNKENSLNISSFINQTMSSPIASSTFHRNANKVQRNSTIKIDDDDDDDNKYEITLLQKEIDDILKRRNKRKSSRFEEGRKSSLQLLQFDEIDDDFTPNQNEKKSIMSSYGRKATLATLTPTIPSRNRINLMAPSLSDRSSFKLRDDNFRISLAPEFDEDIQEIQRNPAITNSQIKDKSVIIDNSVNRNVFDNCRKKSIGEFFCNKAPTIDELGLFVDECDKGVSRQLFPITSENTKCKPSDDFKSIQDGQNVNETQIRSNDSSLLEFNKKEVDFGMISQFATKKIWLTLKNYVSKNMNIKISIDGDCNYFTFTPIDFNDKRNATTIYRTIAANSELSVIVELMCNDNFSDNEKFVDVSATISVTHDDFRTHLARTNLVGKIAITRIDFQITQFPLIIHYGEKICLLFKNNGLLSTEFDVLLSECNLCNANIYSIHPKKVSLVPEEVGGIYITFDVAPTHCTERYVILRDPNGFTCSCSLKGLIDNMEFAPFIQQSEKLSMITNERSSVHVSRNVSSMKSDTEYVCQGKLPIETTKSYLIWECVKINASEMRSFMIRNKSEHKIKFYVFIKSPDFKMIREGNCLPFNDNQQILKLNGHETICLKIVFLPHSVGPCVGKIYFQSCSSNEYEKTIRLFGYGGHTAIGFQRVLKDSNERMWLDMGSLYTSRLNVSQSISVYNHGTLPLVVAIDVNKKPSLSMINAQMEITPDLYSIQQEKKMDFKLKIVFSKDDVKQLYQKSESVIELGVLTVQFIAEPTLYRLKRLYDRFPELNNSKWPLIEKFTEVCSTDNDKNCNEPRESIKHLMTGLKAKEIIITIEKPNIDDLDNDIHDTCAFHSLLTDVTHLH